MAEPGSAVPPGDLAERTAATTPAASTADTLARDGTSPSRASWATHVTAMGIMTVVAGLFLAGAPFLLDYSSDAAAINAVICGLFAAFLGVLRVAGIRHPAVGYVQVALGIWVMASGAFVGVLAREHWIALSVGLAIFFLGLIGLARPPRNSASNL